MTNFDVLAEIDNWLNQVKEIEEPSIEPKFGEQPIGRVTRRLLLLSSATDYLFLISLRTEFSTRLETELGIRVAWRIILPTREVEKYIPPGLKTEIQQ